MYVWLHIQSAINMKISVWIYGNYIMDVLNIFNDGLITFFVVGVVVWCVPSQGGYQVV